MQNNYCLNGKRNASCLAIFFVLLFFFGRHDLNAQAPMSGTYNVPTDIATLKDAVDSLNLLGVSAPVTINLLAGNPQTAPAGGYALTVSGTSGNTVALQGNGNIITANAALTVGALNDAIFKIVGGDYITITGFVMQENPANTVNTPAANNTMTEWGVALLYATTTDGAQNNTIQGNTISLDKTYLNTWGIYSNTRHSANAVTTAADNTSMAGANNFNKFYGNTISNVNMGIALIGSGTAGIQDVGNDIGGSSAGTGNIITNWGGAAALSAYVSNSGTSYGILSNHQTGENISFNSLTSAAVSGTSVTFRGIFKDYTATAPTGAFTSTISSNTVTLSSAFTSGTFEAIRSQGMTALASANLNINSNVVLNCAITNGGSSALVGIINSSVPGNLNMNNNIVQGNSSTATTGGFTGISNTGAVTGFLNITGNQVGNAGSNAITFSAATTGGINGIINSGGAAGTQGNISNNTLAGFSLVSSGSFIGVSNSGGLGTTLDINNNTLGLATRGLLSYSAANSAPITCITNSGGTANLRLNMSANNIRGITHTVAGSSAHTYIINSFATRDQTINSNSFINLTVNTTGGVNFINNNVSLAAGGIQNVNNNAIVTGFNKTGAGGTVTTYTTFASSAAGSTVNNNNNNFSNITLTGATTFGGWINQDGGTPTKTIQGNTFSNITGGTSAVTVINVNFGIQSVISNTITSVTGQGAVTAIQRGTTGIAGANEAIQSNVISGLSSTGTGGNVVGITCGAGSVASMSITANTISTLSSSGASSTIAGIQVTGGPNTIVSNNTVNTFAGSGITSPVANGISVSGGTTTRIFKNKIYDLAQNGAITTTSPAVNGILASAGTTVSIYNNLVGDLKAPSASLADAIRGISVTATTASTTYNVYYNTIRLAASSTGATFGTTGIFHTASATATTAALNLRNNIIINLSTPGSTAGNTVAYRRSGTALGNYAATSNNNLFYAGTPAANSLIFFDGTNSDQTLLTYQTRVATRDNLSVTESTTTFLSTTGSSANFLHVDGSVPSVSESGAVNIATFTDDYDGDVRQGNGGYTGTGTSPDIGADEYEGTNPNNCAGTPTAGSITGASSICAGTSTTFTLGGGVSAGPGITYQWQTATVSGGPYSNLGTALSQTTGTLTAGTYYYLGIVTCSTTGFSDSTAEFTLTVNALPTLTVTPTAGTICLPGGPAIALTAAGASTYTWAPVAGVSPTTGANVSASPTVSTIYTVTGTDVNNCNATATTTITVAPVLNVTVTASPASVCAGGSSTLTAVVGPNTYCASTHSSGCSSGADAMTNIVLNTISNASACGTGNYVYYNGGGAQTTSLAAGSTYTLSVTFGSDPSQNFGAWIDYNQDGALSAAEFLGAASGGANSTVALTFTVPAGAISGTTRLRVVGGNDAAVLASQACGASSSAFGETEDYDVTITGGGAGITYTWTPSDFLGSTNTAVVTASSVTATTTYSATVTSAAGCATTGTVTLTAGSPLSSTAGVSPNDTICAGTTFTLTSNPSGGGAPYSYSWIGPNSYTASVQNPTVTASATTAGVYTITVTDACSAVSVNTVTITVNPQPSLTLTPTSGTICSPGGSPIPLSVSGAASYTWSPTAGLTPPTGASVSANPSVTTVYTVTGADAVGCTSIASATITVAPSLTLTTLNASPASICTNGSSTLTAVASPNITYCPSTHSSGCGSGDDMQIITLSTLSNTTTCGPGAYNYYTGGGAQTTTLTAGNTYTISVKVGTDGNQYFGAWIDFNQDGTLSAAEFLGASANAGSNGTTAVTFTVPAGAIDGVTRLRVVGGNDSPVTATQACGASSSGFGETEDYNVTITGGSSGITYTWTPSDFLGSTNTSVVTASSVTATTVYSVTATSGAGCAVSGTVSVTVDPLSTLTLTAAPSNTICVGASVTISSSIMGGGAPYSYTWSPGGQSTANITVSPTVTTTYTLDVADNCGATASNMITITVNNLPTVSVVASGTLYCDPGTGVTLTAGGANTYTWAPASGLSATTGGTVTATPTLTTNYVVSGTDGNGCVNTASVAITSAPAVTGFTATASPAVICAGDSIDLVSSANTYSLTVFSEDFNSGAPGWTRVNNSIGGTPALAAWTDRPDGFVYNAGTPYHSNDSSQFVQTNSDAQGSGGTAITTLQSPSFSTLGLSNLNVKFYHYYRRLAGDSAFVEASTNGTTWTKVATYSVTAGSEAAFATANIALPATYDNQATVYVRYHYYGTFDWYWSIDNVSVTGSSSSYTYNWTSAPSGFTSAQQNPADVVPSASTTYSVDITNIYGCSATAVTSVTVNPNPVVALGVDTTLCGGNLVLDAGNAGSTYTWNDASSAQTLTVSATGNYYVEVITTQGCKGSDTINVVVNPVPVVNLGVDTIRCGGSVTLDAGNAGSTYTWSTTANTQTVTVNATGTYYVDVTNTQGCTSSDTVDVTINPVPVVNLGNDTSICGGNLVLDAGNAGSTYMWSTSAGTQTITVSATGTYFVDVLNTQGCSSRDTINVTVNPAVSVNLGNDSAICSNASVILDAQNPGASYLWNDNSTLSVLVANGPGTYYVAVSYTNGCNASDTITFTNNDPVVTFVLPMDTVCDNSGIVTLSGGSPVSGTYNGAGVSGGNFDPSVAGNGMHNLTYNYTDGVSGCSGSAMDSIFVDVCVGIDEVNNVAAMVQVFPNPTNGSFTVQLASPTDKVKATLYTVEGKVIFVSELTGKTSFDFDIYKLEDGMYYLQLDAANGSKTVKLVKQF